ncbi:hypothetical protein NKI48_08970 [Mesorhizobium sp. M0644]|uniref:hypothetical protein n=1 Tax=unclassified Mesorhizobium TaxID=325217 RepID=UPI0003CE2810|nr:hypothetical protein [Mesorhizobium sp. LSJC280B00]ESW89031.1 hypothetical protein X772_09255 [Mesorhizobium sp. LSJC280B00]
MPFPIQHKGELVTELEEGEEWLVVGAMIMVAKPKDPAHSRKIPVPEGDIEGLVEVWVGVA